MITASGKVVDISDICTFYRRCILPICCDIRIFERADFLQIRSYLQNGRADLLWVIASELPVSGPACLTQRSAHRGLVCL
jgi:hypothetical protein